MAATVGARSGVATAALLALMACGGEPTAPVPVDPFPPAPDDTVPYVYQVPRDLRDGWEPAHAQDVGMDPAPLVRLVDLVREGIYANVHGILVVKDGKLVLEEYFNGVDFRAAVGDSIVGPWVAFGASTPHNLASVTKSITATLVGAAIREGFLTTVDTAVYDFYPELADVRDARKDSITIRHLLTMTSGLEWDEATHGYGDPRNDINALFRQTDPIRYVLSKPTVAEPGTKWVYNGGGTNVLGDILRRASGMPLDHFADRVLFTPLGITDRTWVRLANDVIYTSGDLRLRPRDMARIGLLYLRDGAWSGRQIVDPTWIDASRAWAADTRNPTWGYGFQWWLHDFVVEGETYPSFGARGWGGQMITVFPDHDLVVVQTGGNYRTSDPADAVLSRFVLPALR
ncbi:MAG: serine hydrolase [Longimicrobiales bacterium]